MGMTLIGTGLGIVLTFITLAILPLGNKLLGHDRGRKFAAGSEVNIGKPTGVGFYFVIIFTVLSMIFGEHSIGFIIMMILTIVNMIFGFLDDRSKAPWGEYIKGALDALTAIIGGIVFAFCINSSLIISLANTVISLPAIVYAILAIILIIVSINATNATDGVDGLSGTLSILSIATFMCAHIILTGVIDWQRLAPGLIFIGVILAYLWFNHFPSKMLMGDAGSRAVGFFIAFYAMYLGIPVAYLIVGLPFLIDGGLSILKITIGRLTHKKVIILKNVTTPIHDHLKKRKGFSVPKTWLTLSVFGLLIDIVYLGILLIIR